MQAKQIDLRVSVLLTFNISPTAQHATFIVADMQHNSNCITCSTQCC
jgi:hypothetical protein